MAIDKPACVEPTTTATEWLIDVHTVDVELPGLGDVTAATADQEFGQRCADSVEPASTSVSPAVCTSTPPGAGHSTVQHVACHDTTLARAPGPQIAAHAWPPTAPQSSVTSTFLVSQHIVANFCWQALGSGCPTSRHPLGTACRVGYASASPARATTYLIAPLPFVERHHCLGSPVA
jgi:hypothetical protein